MSEDKSNTCQYRKCGKLSDIVYLGCGLCEKHWVKICDMPTDKAHKLLKIEKDNDGQESKSKDSSQDSV